MAVNYELKIIMRIDYDLSPKRKARAKYQVAPSSFWAGG